MKKQHRRWLGWVIGAVILALILLHVSHSPEWRNFQWRRLWLLLVHVKLEFLVPAALISYVTYVARAVRWKFFVDPIKKCSLWVLFEGQIFGFSSIYLVGRAGEVVRPAYIARAEKLSFTSQVAVWVLERLYDSFALVILFALGLYVEALHPQTAHSATILHAIHSAAVGVLILCAVIVALLVLYRIYSEEVLIWIGRLLAGAPKTIRNHALNFLRSFSDGLNVIQNRRDFSASVLCTIVLWALNVTAIWLVFRSLGGQLQGLSWWVAALTLVFSSLGLIIQLPGVGGGYQVVILLVLKNLFQVSAEGAASAAILTWLTVMAPCLILGLALLIHKGLSLKKLQAITEEEYETTAPRI